MYTAPTVAQLAEFSGRSVASYDDTAASALAQGTLLFSILTELDEAPEDERNATLALNGILDMADYIYLARPYAAVKAKPFQSETIMSYSYSRGSSVALAVAGKKTGMLWWDLAIARLTIAESVVSYGSIAAFEREHHPLTGAGLYRDEDDIVVLLGPADLLPDMEASP